MTDTYSLVFVCVCVGDESVKFVDENTKLKDGSFLALESSKVHRWCQVRVHSSVRRRLSFALSQQQENT